ncbi:hypothetical protein [Paenibacillus sacheonensis]|uniref:Uncharacterized protein n=1 Tax=Paenibacillus sacheonensis TaxID=742054 RepID=A0A7X4YQB7_9BACL|nr:hypothetical protein [Paenibacillus sacheonensis]MBM7566395.1 hypothetical protein [Paenibacillus sacheonensis]NBC70595.1 hypothetical protein [Paenibacillus sacheonensis]
MKRLVLDAEGRVQPVCSKTHIAYSFHLDQPGGKLWIDFAYEPKNLEDREQSRARIAAGVENYTEPAQRELVMDRWESFLPLKNLITVSVDDPARHRGAGHRHDPEQLLLIGAEEASPGFVRGELPEGLWRVTLSLHAIVTESCSYRLRIHHEEA